jgi:hypothetical protein
VLPSHLASSALCQSIGEKTVTTPNPTTFPDFPDITHMGVKKDTFINLRAGRQLYRMPTPYFAHWVYPDELIKGIDVKHPDFTFVMPSRQPSKKKGMFPMTYAASNEGGDTLEFDVAVNNFKFFDADSKDIEQYVLPEKRIENSTVRGRPPFYQPMPGHSGILVGEHDHGNGIQKSYRHAPGSSPHFLLRGSPLGRPNRPIIPDVTGYVYYPTERVYFYVRMSEHAMEYWRETFEASRNLGLSWLVNSAQ